MDFEKMNRINETVLSLHGITDPFELSETLLQHLSGLIDYDVAIWGFPGSLDEGDTMGTILISSPYGPEYDRKLHEEHQSHSQYDYLKWLFTRTESLVYRDTDFINSEIRANSFYYKDFLEKFDIIYACGVIIAHDNHVTASLALYNKAESGDFSDEDLFTLEYFKPHLEMAFVPHSKVLSTNSTPSYVLKERYRLTDREIEIIRHLLEGCTNNEMAAALCVQTNTIKKHLYNIYTKFDVSSRTQLFKFMIENDLIKYFDQE